jgi:hypothetical protein
MVYRVGPSTAGKPDRIALEVYGTTKLDWLIIAFNNQVNPFGWPKAGSVIKLPIPDLVFGELS